MPVTDNYLEYLDEDFNLVNKVFKANILKSIMTKIKKNVKGKQFNLPGIKAALKPIPVISQDKINKFLDKYVPNYKQNYTTAKRHFDKKYPTEENTDVLAGITAAITPLDTKKTLQDQIKRTQRVYTSNLGTSSAGGGLVIFLTGLTITMVSWSVPDLFDNIGKMGLAILVGVFLMFAGISAALR